MLTWVKIFKICCKILMSKTGLNWACVASENESRFPQYFFNCARHINRISREEKQMVGKDKSRQRLEAQEKTELTNNGGMAVWQEPFDLHTGEETNIQAERRRWLQTKLIFPWTMAGSCKRRWWIRYEMSHRNPALCCGCLLLVWSLSSQSWSNPLLWHMNSCITWNCFNKTRGKCSHTHWKALVSWTGRKKC